MIKLAVTLNNGIEPLRKLSSYTAAPLFDLAIRLYVSWFFFKAGLIKFSSFWAGDFSSVIEKFELWYPVNLLGTQWDPVFSAYASLFGELLLPILLALGLFSRFAALGLVIMTAVITFGTTNAVFFESVMLFVITGSLFLKGPGFFSLDHLLVSFLRARSAVMPDFQAQIGLHEVDTDLPGHERSGRFVRAIATGFWYTVIGIVALHCLASIITLIPGIDLTSAMITHIFSMTTPQTALAGYFLAIVYSYITGIVYAFASQKMDVVFTFKKIGIWIVGSGIIFMLLHLALV